MRASLRCTAQWHSPIVSAFRVVGRVRSVSAGGGLFAGRGSTTHARGALLLSLVVRDTMRVVLSLVMVHESGAVAAHGA